MHKWIVSAGSVLGILLLIVVLHVIAFNFGWYWNPDGVDGFYHFLGGFWIALLVFYLIQQRPQFFDVRRNLFTTALFGISMVALVGVGWEIFEFEFFRFFIHDEVFLNTHLGIEDTISDLTLDLSGALLLVFLYIPGVRKN